VTLKRNRSKALKIVLLPILMCIFLMGFCMYCSGENKKNNGLQRQQPEKDNVTLMPLDLEEQKEIIRA